MRLKSKNIEKRVKCLFMSLCCMTVLNLSARSSRHGVVVNHNDAIVRVNALLSRRHKCS